MLERRVDKGSDVALPEEPGHGLGAHEPATVRVHPRREHGRHCRKRRVGVVVIVLHIADRTTVRRDVPVEAPLVPHEVVQNAAVCARRNGTALLGVARTVDPFTPRLGVVAAHHPGRVAPGHTSLKRREVRVLHILISDDRGKAVATSLFAVGRVVLEARRSLNVAGGAVALHPSHKLGAIVPIHRWVFTWSLLATTPPRVAENVDVWGPERECMVHSAADVVVLATALSPGDVANGVPQSLVVRRGHAADLRERGGDTVPGNAVQRLRPPVVCRPVNSGDGRSSVDHEPRLFGIRQVSDNQSSPGLGRLGVVAPWVLGR
mmetsp:Transcript_25868/g.67879  ORF Transcript_25868/g.67879 Transcript_25868/m.67879 type:complete len:320 (+) Transcript_25868:1336-2295(+)